MNSEVKVFSNEMELLDAGSAVFRNWGPFVANIYFAN